MNSIASASPFQSLSMTLHALRGAVAAWGGRGLLRTVLVLLLYRRLGEICGRMERLAARFQAGRVWRRGAVVASGAVDGVTRRPRARGVRVWPGAFGWLVRAASHEAAGFGSQLRAVLEQPEMVALLIAAPQAARLLRPVCRILAVETSLLRPVVAVASDDVASVRQRQVWTDGEVDLVGDDRRDVDGVTLFSRA